MSEEQKVQPTPSWVVHKFQLSNEAPTRVRMSSERRYLSVQQQGKITVLWVLHNTHAVSTERIITPVPTGRPLLGEQFDVSAMEYISTVQYQGGGFVVHYFDITNALNKDARKSIECACFQ